MSGTRVALTALLELRRRGAGTGGGRPLRRRRPGRRRHPARPRLRPRRLTPGVSALPKGGMNRPRSTRALRLDVGPAGDVEAVDPQGTRREPPAHDQVAAPALSSGEQPEGQRMRRRVVPDHHDRRHVVAQPAQRGQDVVGIGPVEVGRALLRRRAAPCRRAPARPWPAVRAAGRDEGDLRVAAPCRPARDPLPSRPDEVGRGPRRRAAPGGPGRGRSRRRPGAGRPPPWRGGGATGCGSVGVTPVRRRRAGSARPARRRRCARCTRSGWSRSRSCRC